MIQIISFIYCRILKTAFSFITFNKYLCLHLIKHGEFGIFIFMILQHLETECIYGADIHARKARGIPQELLSQLIYAAFHLGRRFPCKGNGYYVFGFDAVSYQIQYPVCYRLCLSGSGAGDDLQILIYGFNRAALSGRKILYQFFVNLCLILHRNLLLRETPAVVFYKKR